MWYAIIKWVAIEKKVYYVFPVIGSTFTLAFAVCVFFHEHSQFTGQQGKGEAISLTPLFHFHPLHILIHKQGDTV